MHISKFLAGVALFSAFAAAAEPYKVIVPMSNDEDGAMARLYDFDTSLAVDSVMVADGAATFTGSVDEPFLARVMVDGARGPVFILESGTISFSKDRQPFGSMLNDRLRDFTTEVSKLQALFRDAANDSIKNQIYDRYKAMQDSVMAENADNMLGYYMFLNSDAPQLDAEGLRALLAKYPAFASRGRAQKLLDVAQRREATQPGNKFVDFEVTYNGQTHRLSDYVGKGKYTLVDFWASWCGPCIRQTPVLKGLQQKYGDKLDIVGFAVWDDPADTQAAIEKHGITWPTVVNCQTIPTDLYGIPGIPCIILFGPDGTIISRDKQGDELVADVDAALNPAK